MGWVAALLGILAVAAAAAWLRSRRASPRPALPAGDSASPSGPASAAVPAPDGAWIPRLVQTLPAALGRGRLAEQEAAGPDGRAAFSLQGNLSQTPLHDLLQYLSLGRKSGILELASGRRTGRMVLAGGRIGRTSYRGKEGMEAAFLMLDLAEGDFEFYEQAPDGSEADRRSADGSPPLEAVDLIMLWMARKPKKQRTT